MDDRFYDFFLFRRPDLSLNTILGFNERFEEDTDCFEQDMISIFSLSEFQNALFVASPALYKSLSQILDSNYQGDIRPICKSLYRYLVRMCSRPTPFGLMAGVCSGEITNKSTKISFPLLPEMQPKIQLSFGALAKLSKAIAERLEVFPHLKLTCNTSLYRFQNVYRYIKRSGNENDSFIQHELEANRYIDLITELSRSAISYSDLVSRLVAEGLDSEDSVSLIRTLYDQQLLVSDIDAGPICESGLSDLTASIEKNDGLGHITKDLRSMIKILSQYRDVRTVDRKIRSVLRLYYEPAESEQILLVNSVVKELECRISQAPISVIQKELDELSALSDPAANPELERFKNEFYQKFQTRYVPLLEVLDPKTGIGYGNKSFSEPFELEHLKMLTSSDTRSDSSLKSRMDELRLSLYEQSLSENKRKIILRQRHLTGLTTHNIGSSDYRYVMGKFIAGSQTELDRGNFQFSLAAVGSNSPFGLMGRFCNSDPVLKGMVTQAISCEELDDPDVIYAEINHLPSNKEANILLRPHLRKYEIPYLAASKTKLENQILPQDLYLLMTDRNNMVLWSKTHNKRVIPCLTNAHNYSNGLPLYRLLCDLANQNAAAVMNWNWGKLSDREFLPRIQYKHLILSPAQWNLSMEMLCGNTTANDLKALFTKMKIPQLVQIVDADQLLLVDSNSSVSMGMLLSMLRRRSIIKLVEFSDLRHRGLIRHGNETFTHEVIIPFKAVKHKLPEVQHIHQTREQKRLFPAGSEWIYIKVYLSPSRADSVLIDNIKPFCDELLAKSRIEKWFFVRYNDTGHHLRIRWQIIGNQDQIFSVLKTICDMLQALLSLSKIDKFKIDTYDRELERYAQIDFSLTETLFYNDSVAVCRLLQLATESDIPKWQIALRAVDRYLTSFEYDLSRKRAFISHLHSAFHVEFNSEDSYIYEMDKSYRAHVTEVRIVLAKEQVTTAIRQLDQCLQSSLSYYERIGKMLLDSHHSDGYVAGVVHMFLNRLFCDNHRQVEFIVYHYLKKYYNSAYFSDTNHHNTLKNSSKPLLK